MRFSGTIALAVPAVAALLMLTGTGELAAQSTKSSGMTNTSRPVSAGEKVPPHAQPRAADAPANENKTIEQMSAEDKALDQKLRGICRGC